jgi:two-component system NtrC family sensor kinase
VRLRDLSWRLKVPLAITAVIVLTEVVVTTLLVTRALADARRDLEATAESMTRLLARSLRDPLLRDDLWQAFEVISAPLAARRNDSPLQGVVVLDAARQVFVASDPRRLPVLTPAAVLPEPLAGVTARAASDGRFQFALGRGPVGPELAAAGPILADDGTRLGTVVLDFDGAIYAQRLRAAVVDVALLSVPGLSIAWPPSDACRPRSPTRSTTRSAACSTPSTPPSGMASPMRSRAGRWACLSADCSRSGRPWARCWWRRGSIRRA